MAKVYLETSLFSACVSTRSDPKTAGWRVTSNEWWETQARRHELFISAEVIAELSAPEFPNSEALGESEQAYAFWDYLHAIGACGTHADYAGPISGERR